MIVEKVDIKYAGIEVVVGHTIVVALLMGGSPDARI